MSLASALRFSTPDCHSRPFTVSLPSPRGWLSGFGTSFVLSVLENAISAGHLTIMECDEIWHFGRRTEGGNNVHLKVLNKNFWSRVLLSGDLGFSEAFMIGDVEVSDLRAVMDLWLENQSGFSGLSSALFRLTSAISGLSNAFLGQSQSQALLNASHGYDQSNELFKCFLGRDMVYSCALWGPEEHGPAGDLDREPLPCELDSAQTRKLQHVITKARIRPGDRVLEFGSGWGGLAIAAALAVPNCEVDSITLSIEQKTLAEERARALGLQDRVRFHLMDYRNLPVEWEKQFDVFVSIEMLEHVGTQYYNTYFGIVDWALKTDGARVVVSTSTFPEHRYSQYQPEDFMRRYMWPNTNLPSAVTLINAATTSSQGRFHLESVESHGAHYARTLREWGRRLDANLVQSTLAKEYPTLRDRTEFECFKRKWQYLFAYAECGFTSGYITCHMLTFHRQNDPPHPYDVLPSKPKRQ